MKAAHLIASSLLIAWLSIHQAMTNEVNPSQIYVEKLIPIHVVNLEDQGFDDRVDMMVYDEGNFFFMDQAQKTIFKLGPADELTKLPIRLGESSDEILGVEAIHAWGGALYVLDGESGFVKVFAGNGDFSKDIFTHTITMGRFHVDSNFQVTMSTPEANTALITVDETGNKIRTFGGEEHTKQAINISDHRHVFGLETGILTVSLYRPFVTSYFPNGKLRFESSLENFPYIRDHYQRAKRYYANNPEAIHTVHFTHFTDAYLHKNQLFYMTHRRNASKVVMIFDLDEHGVHLKSIFEPSLPEENKTKPYYTSLCVNDRDELVIFNQTTRQLLIYDMD